jgi:hypothetical protein
MSQIITIRLTPKRKQLLNAIKRRFNLEKNSEAIDLALGMSSDNNIDYKSRIEKVSGIVSLKGKKDSVRKIRLLRNGL